MVLPVVCIAGLLGNSDVNAPFIIPLLLSVISLLLGGLTVSSRWGVPRWLAGLVRVPLVIIALLLSLIATLFFMGEPQAVFSHWQAAVRIIWR
ncbi:hypothetical protein [Pseudomonas parafulva]|uniref:hypothetical protein n=1 Tax=Pseudomonas parafulva TaxID=157782 RepID=UPI0012B57449|nr:hypothetical protein [Pseudomonas parafulva]